MKEKKTKAFPIIYPNAAGIDISSKEHYVAVNPESTEKPIRAFGAFTEDLHALVVFFKRMQSRYSCYGGYWYLLGKFIFSIRRCGF
ncbi:MAG: hypothetical protein IPP06_12100 [Saprospiraceae bacterium]|nr:hypothetical protein [Candidatus Vicinibacter affinis]